MSSKWNRHSKWGIEKAIKNYTSLQLIGRARRNILKTTFKSGMSIKCFFFEKSFSLDVNL
jgi:hypothetical protein